jgi:thymidylate synthase
MSIEHEYLHLLEECLISPVRETRNGTTHSVFGRSLSHNLSESFPLLTTKKVFFRGVVEELSWFLRGSTNVNELKEKGVHIWDKNASDFDPENEKDAGAIYGFQWRHFGAKYIDCDTDYAGQGVDQIESLLNGIRDNPYSRRHVLNAWDPGAKASLPPCHVLYQFYVKDNHLSVQMYQRSADLFLGVPFNIASTALLTHLIAHECDLEVGMMHIVFGDAHIYESHASAVSEQLGRIPRRLPSISVVRQKNRLKSLHTDDAVILDYDPCPRIRAEMIL